jgi:hypothetical protein
MSLFPNVSVTSTAKLVGYSRASTQQIAFTNNGVGTGLVYFQLVDNVNSPNVPVSNLTTSNGTLIPSQPNPYILILTPGYQQSSFNPTKTNDDSDGFAIFLISNTTAQVSVQTVPF